MLLAMKARAGRIIALEALAKSRAEGTARAAAKTATFRSVRPLLLQKRINNVVAFNDRSTERRRPMPMKTVSYA